MSRRLLMFSLAADADDPVLGFALGWVNALAAHYDALDLVTMRAGRTDTLAANVRVYSLGKERGYSEARRAWEFYRILVGLLLRQRYAAAFAHMNQLFALMAAPLLRLRGVRQTLWYAHKATPRSLWLAEKVVDRVVTASSESFRLPSQKVRVVGHGIDTDQFTPAPPQDGSSVRPFTLLSVARIAPVKRQDVMLEALRLLASEHGIRDAQLRLVGSPLLPTDERYLEELRRSVQAHGLVERVDFVPAVPHERIADEYRAADVLLNVSETGSLDKALLEAMACGVPVLSANDAGRAMLAAHADTLSVPPGDVPALARALAALYHQTPDARRALGMSLRALVVEGHSLRALALRLSRLF